MKDEKARPVKEWLTAIVDTNLRNRALNNMKRRNEDRLAQSLAHALNLAFVWSASPEGGGYWINKNGEARSGSIVLSFKTKKLSKLKKPASDKHNGIGSDLLLLI